MLFRKKEKPSGPVDFLIVGLGNPGQKYVGTRHNAGFMVLEALAAELNVRVDRAQFRSLTGQGRIGDKRVLLMMPQTFMNNSGEAVRDAMQFYKLSPEQVIVLYDDISLPVGGLRIRRKGSNGGQKGMGSIIYLTGSDNFPRVRLGVGEKPHPDYDLADWVLSRFTTAEQPLIRDAAARAVQAVCRIVQGDIDGAMNAFSR